MTLVGTATVWASAGALLAFISCASPREHASSNPPPVVSRSTTLPETRHAPAIEERAFSTYAEATEYVRSTYDGERIDTSRSSWITGAEYFEAGGRCYLILGMNHKDYIFEGVPTEVWEGFKAAPSLGTYYNEHIRGRYGFDLR